MGTRSESMAVIDAALQKPASSQQPIPSSNTQGASLTNPSPTPGGDTPLTDTFGPDKTTMTADEERAYKTNRQRDLDEAQRYRQQMAEEQKQQTAFEQSAKATVNSLARVVNSAGARVSRLPTWGSLSLPLIVLIVFFLFLIPVNGHTRLTWLWLTFGGNAEIKGSNQSSSSSGSQQTPSTSGQPKSQNQTPQTVPPGPGVPGLASAPAGGTYAEDV